MPNKNEDIDITIFSEEQIWWNTIKDNCSATIKQFKDSIKLQKEIEKLADSKIKQLAKK